MDVLKDFEDKTKWENYVPSPKSMSIISKSQIIGVNMTKESKIYQPNYSTSPIFNGST